MRKIIIAVVALLLLGGGGAGAYFYFMKPAEASPGEVEKGAEEHGKQAGKEDKKGGGHGEGGEAKFVKLDPLILPIINNEGLTQVVSLVIAIEVADEESKKTVEQLVPRLNDAFIQDLYGVLSDKSAVKAGILQVGYIKDRLNKITVRVLGEDMGTDVLLQVVQQRPA